MYRPKIDIHLPHKLMLDSRRKTSCFVLALSQLCLGANLIFIYTGVAPLYFLTLSIALLFIEKLRKKPMANQALQFCIKRVIVHILAILAVLILQSTLQNINTPFGYWNLLIFTLAPLSIYDAFALAEGRLGFFIKIK